MIFKVFLFYFSVIEIVLIFGNSQQLRGETCQTPDNQYGICINPKECPSALERFKRRTQADIEYLIKSKCGPPESNNKQKLCCGLQSSQQSVPVPVPTQRQPPSTNPFAITTTSRIDLRNHRNAPKINSPNCSPASIDKIADGEVTKLFEYPWMALISYENQYGERGFKCAGTLINEYYVLTAAHCVYQLEKGLKPIGVRLGEHDVTKRRDCIFYLTADRATKKECADPTQDTLIAKIIPHPEFRNTSFQYVDIALIKLATPAKLSRKNIATVCLPLGIRVKSKHGTITGWGATEKGIQSDILLKAEMRFMSYDECAQIYDQVTSNQVCAKGIKGDPCHGDSGGPIVAMESIDGSDKAVQLGIVSVGTTFCGVIKRPTVFTNVVRNIEWILDNIN